MKLFTLILSICLMVISVVYLWHAVDLLDSNPAKASAYMLVSLWNLAGYWMLSRDDA